MKKTRKTNLTEFQILIVLQFPEEEIHTTGFLRLLAHFNKCQQLFNSNKQPGNYDSKNINISSQWKRLFLFKK